MLKPTHHWELHLAGLITLCGYIALAWISQSHSGYPHLLAFYGLLIVVTVPTLTLFLLVHRDSIRLSLPIVVGWCVVFRVVGLFGVPLYEDDYFRYLWDAFQFAQLGTPYGSIPVDSFTDPSLPLVMQSVLNGINYPDLPTIYGPTLEYLFLVSYWIQPGSLLPLQWILVGFDLLLIGLLYNRVRPEYLLLYSWCPLLINEIAFSAHPEIVAITLVVAALVCRQRNYRVLVGHLVGLAVGAKIFAWLFVPFLLWKAGFRAILWFVLTVALLYVPSIISGQSELGGLLVFIREWEFNAPMFSAIKALSSHFIAQMVLLIPLSVTVLWYWNHWRQQPVWNIPRGDWLMGGLLIASPVINPWYVLWILPFAALYPSFTSWVAASVVFLAYITALNLQDWSSDPFSQPIWSLVAQCTAIAVAFCFDAKRSITHRSIATGNS